MFEAAITVSPQHPGAYHYMAEVYLSQALEPQKALELVDHALKKYIVHLLAWCKANGEFVGDAKYYALVSGKNCAIETLLEAECRQALLEKLVEEAQEARDAILRSAAPDELITELADLQEVIAAVLAAWEISPDLVQQVQAQRHADRGGFERRLKLLWTEDGDENG